MSSLFKLNKVIVMFKDHETITFDDMKDQKLVLKEGCEYKIKYILNINNEVIKGLSNITSYFKGGFCVSKDTVSFGDFNAPSPTIEISVPKEDNKWNKAPSGFIARGSYASKIQFLSEDNKINIEVPYSVEIKKDWL